MRPNQSLQSLYPHQLKRGKDPWAVSIISAPLVAPCPVQCGCTSIAVITMCDLPAGPMAGFWGISADPALAQVSENQTVGSD